MRETLGSAGLGGRPSAVDLSAILDMQRDALRDSGEASGRPSVSKVNKPKRVSREQEYWYGVEISPPLSVSSGAGDAPVPNELKAMLAGIQKNKANRTTSTSSTSTAS
jgi:hypothetical protein